jgi:FkbM family methyltransferase
MRIGLEAVAVMAFDNVRSIFGIRSPWSSLKLLPAAASCSRPAYRVLWQLLLKPFVRNGSFSIRYYCQDRSYRVWLRLSDLGADFCSVKELALRDVYKVDRGFNPDLVIDGGGNIGLFTLRAATLKPAGPDALRLIVCEPLPRNVEQIQRHLAMNRVEAELLPCCLGGSRKEMPFYCRSANQSSFDPSEPYEAVSDIQVMSLQKVIGGSKAQRILVKLDIEGMEVEVLEAFVPQESRAVYVVGELHNHPKNAVLMDRIFARSGWKFEMFDVDRNTSSFRACSPAATHLLSWTSSIDSGTETPGH